MVMWLWLCVHCTGSWRRWEALPLLQLLIQAFPTWRRASEKRPELLFQTPVLDTSLDSASSCPRPKLDPSFPFRLQGRGSPEENTSITGGVQGQGGSEQPGLERDVPVHGSGVGLCDLWRPLLTQTVLIYFPFLTTYYLNKLHQPWLPRCVCKAK